MEKFFKIILAAMFFLAVSGCAALNSTQKTTEDEGVFMDPEEIISVNPDLRFDDLPVPVGFLIDIERSYAFQNPDTRVAILRYVGKESPRTLVEFFKEQMPRYNWEMINQVEFEKIVLNFEKRDESCIVMIEPLRSKIQITVPISPRS